MQVAHQNDFITHAVIGGAETIDFGISNSAEFFNILSSTLYKNQILAVTREVLCNAWDAHIEAGCTHIPVQITLTADKLTIRDFGTGIHRNDMGLIYGTYGNSTKKNDGKQTGGFGLGCKAPFAYTDHFEVISSHDGVRTIYNLSKSSAQAMGKPGIVPIASFPTDESGLQVSINVANSTDRNKFMTLIHRIVRNGDMNMEVNGGKIEGLGFDTMKSNYYITSDSNIIDNVPKIMVRYGNVVYPVDRVDGIAAEYERISLHLIQMQGNTIYRILFQAPPHSISVTPSRESLSMQEHTIKTLKKLFHDFIDMLDNPVSGFRQRCDMYAKESVKQAVLALHIPALLSPAIKLPYIVKTNAPSKIVELDEMAQRHMQVNYPEGMAFRKKDITWRLQGMVDAKLLDRGLVQTYLRVLATTTGGYDDPNWLQRQVIAPLLVDMVKAKLDVAKLYGYDNMDHNAPGNYERKGIAPLVKAVSISPRDIFYTLPYLRNIVVISTSCRDILDRANQRKAFKEMNIIGMPVIQGFLFYHVGLKKNDRENALKFFKQSGMVVIDLNVKTACEARDAKDKASNLSPRKPTLKGTVSMLSVRMSNPKDKTISTVLSRKDDAKRIDNPEFVIQVSMRNEVAKDCFAGWSDAASQAIVSLFGDKGGITFNSAVHDKWIMQGVKEMKDYLNEKVSAEIAINKRIHEYLAFDPHRAITEAHHLYHYNDNALVYFAYNTPVLQKEFGLVNNLTEKDKNYLCLWKTIIADRYMSHVDSIAKVKLQVNAIPLDPANVAFLERFKNNPLITVLNETKFIKLVNDSTTKPEHIAGAINVLRTALKK